MCPSGGACLKRQECKRYAKSADELEYSVEEMAERRVLFEQTDDRRRLPFYKIYSESDAKYH